MFGQLISNPLGVAAGFDKNAEAVDGELLRTPSEKKEGSEM